uniref:NADH-ubiquinone oxidoreductase chain 6 n=1 Tax=Euphylidorea dispar TaxID=2719062 RepID=A0A7G7CEB8_9DIPT|nr:NADH dehydrogenase subunit 6 [Euphylidorea dispar]
MTQLILIIISLTISLMFMQMKHPLAMGMTLLIQTMFICMITGYLAKTFWFSYILFLIFLGGMLVLFIYVTTLASNEMFNLSVKMIYLTIMINLTLTFTLLIMDFSLINSFLMNHDMNLIYNLKNLMPENNINLTKLYNFPTNMLTIILINYLFLTLIIIVKITNNFKGPLRKMN